MAVLWPEDLGQEEWPAPPFPHPQHLAVWDTVGVLWIDESLCSGGFHLVMGIW